MFSLLMRPNTWVFETWRVRVLTSRWNNARLFVSFSAVPLESLYLQLCSRRSQSSNISRQDQKNAKNLPYSILKTIPSRATLRKPKYRVLHRHSPAMLMRRGAVFVTVETFITGGFSPSPGRRVSNAMLLQLSAFSLVMTAAFSGCFMSFLTVLRDPPQPLTLAEVDARVQRVYAGSGIKHYFPDLDPDDVVLSLMSKLVPIGSDTKPMQRDVASSLTAAVVSGREQLQRLQGSKRMVDAVSKRALTHLVPECLMSPAHVAFHTRRNWPARERISSMLQSMHEVGIDLFMERFRDYMYQLIYSYVRVTGERSLPRPPDEPTVLAVGSLAEPMGLLAVGLALAAVVFARELAAERRRRRRLRAARRVVPVVWLAHPAPRA